MPSPLRNGVEVLVLSDSDDDDDSDPEVEGDGSDKENLPLFSAPTDVSQSGSDTDDSGWDSDSEDERVPVEDSDTDDVSKTSRSCLLFLSDFMSFYGQRTFPRRWTTSPWSRWTVSLGRHKSLRSVCLFELRSQCGDRFLTILNFDNFRTSV